MLHQGWIRREFFLLKKLHEMGANVPEVYDWTPESILMEFIGDDEIAPRLIDVELTKKQAIMAFEAVLKAVKLMLECGVVHSDLSAYNILWWQDKPWIIDLPQAIDMRQNLNRTELLKRDLNNLTAYFSRYFAINDQEIYRKFEVYT